MLFALGMYYVLPFRTVYINSYGYTFCVSIVVAIHAICRLKMVITEHTTETTALFSLHNDAYVLCFTATKFFVNKRETQLRN